MKRGVALAALQSVGVAMFTTAAVMGCGRVGQSWMVNSARAARSTSKALYKRPLGAFLGPPASLRFNAGITRPMSAPAAEAEKAGVVDEEIDPGVVPGTDLRVVKYPHPALRAKNEEVVEFDAEVQKLAKDMFKVMYAAQGVGLAAPQVGKNVRLMVFNPDGDRARWLSETTLVNPVIVAKSKGTDVDSEACLSFPGMTGDVERSLWIKVEAFNSKGKKIKKKYEGWEARVFQHEYDHLDGVVYIDHLSAEHRGVAQPVLDELISAHGEGAAL